MPEAAQVALGGQLAVSLTLQNTSDREACYHLYVSGIPVDWYDLNQPRIALLPAASAQILLAVHPRRGTVAAAGRYALTVQVRAEDDGTLQAAAVVALTVSTASGVDMPVQPTDVDMSVQPTEVEGRAATFRLTYHNHSPAPVAIALLAHDSEERLRFRPEPAEPVVVPGDRASSIAVHIVPKVRPLVGVPQAYGIVFRALPLWTVPESQADLVREARFTYMPDLRLPALARAPVWVRRLPVWTGALALVLLVLLLVVAGGRTLATATRTAGMRMPAPTEVVRAVGPGGPRAPAQGRTRRLSRPSIRRFTLVHRRQGQPYELVWQTSDVQTVTLDGRPVSTHGALVLPAPLHSATYRLVATNGARRATAYLHVVVDALTTDRHAVVLARPDIATFAVRRRHGQRYAIWLVGHAVSVHLQGQPVASAGEQLILPGASTLR